MESALRTLLYCCLIGLTLSAPQYVTPQPNVAVRGLGQAQAYQSQQPSQIIPNYPQQSIPPPVPVSTVAPYASGISAVTAAPLQHHQQQPLPQVQQAPVQFNQAQQYSAAGAAAFSRPAVHSGAGFQQPNQAYQAQGGHGGSGDGGNAKYNFNWEVNDEYNQYGHTETREGYKTTGSYYARLPDGRTQIVNYVADQAGYRPEVKYEGQAIAVAAPRPLGGANVQYQGAAQQGNYAGQGVLPLQGAAPVAHQAAPFIATTARPAIYSQTQAGYGGQVGGGFQAQAAHGGQVGGGFQAQAAHGGQVGGGFQAQAAHGGQVGGGFQAQAAYGGQVSGGFHTGPQQIQHSLPQTVSPAPAFQVTPAPYAGAGLQNVHQAGGVHQNSHNPFGANQQSHLQLSGPGPIQQNYQQQQTASHAQFVPQQFQQQNFGAFQSVTQVAPVTPAQGKY